MDNGQRLENGQDHERRGGQNDMGAAGCERAGRRTISSD